MGTCINYSESNNSVNFVRRMENWQSKSQWSRRSGFIRIQFLVKIPQYLRGGWEEREGYECPEARGDTLHLGKEDTGQTQESWELLTLCIELFCKRNRGAFEWKVSKFCLPYSHRSFCLVQRILLHFLPLPQSHLSLASCCFCFPAARLGTWRDLRPLKTLEPPELLLFKSIYLTQVDFRYVVGFYI